MFSVAVVNGNVFMIGNKIANIFQCDEFDSAAMFCTYMCTSIFILLYGCLCGGSGYFVSEEMRKSVRFKFYFMAMGTSLEELEISVKVTNYIGLN